MEVTNVKRNLTNGQMN